MTAGVFPVKEIHTYDRNIAKKQFISVPNSLIDEAIFLYTGNTLDELQMKDRSIEVLESRQVAMYFYRLNGNSFNNIGLSFHKDHSTVVHACKKIETYYGTNSEKRLTTLIDNISKYTGIKIEKK